MESEGLAGTVAREPGDEKGASRGPRRAIPSVADGIQNVRQSSDATARHRRPHGAPDRGAIHRLVASAADAVPRVGSDPSAAMLVCHAAARVSAAKEMRVWMLASNRSDYP